MKTALIQRRTNEALQYLSQCVYFKRKKGLQTFISFRTVVFISQSHKELDRLERQIRQDLGKECKIPFSLKLKVNKDDSLLCVIVYVR